ncbi:unnamed protein product [Citrullus colocynthis]|uniref:Uncharacterized protein n=1 Tax=Citrullus colocynthis TaxID=252529 RepID=A0ABP0YJN3_9ROSI
MASDELIDDWKRFNLSDSEKKTLMDLDFNDSEKVTQKATFLMWNVTKKALGQSENQSSFGYLKASSKENLDQNNSPSYRVFG